LSAAAPSRSDVATVYLAGVAQGVALVTFPAAATVLTDPHAYGLSNSQYGALFVPQAALAVVASLCGAAVTRRAGIKRTCLIGLGADLVSMSLLLASSFFAGRSQLAYGLLLVATAALGLGFGFTVPALNTLAARYFPAAVDRAVLVLNALLGLGTVLAPLLVGVFVGLGVWWLLPALTAASLLALLAAGARLSASQSAAPAGSPAQPPSPPRRLWIYALFALLYGIVETMSGNWAELFMSGTLAAPASVAPLALTAFWGGVTAGRLALGFAGRRLPDRTSFRILPFVCAVAFGAASLLRRGQSTEGVLVFALAGLGASALLPLTLSFAQKELSALAASVAGGLIAAYQTGYGLAAFGAGPLDAATGLSLQMTFAYAALVALACGALSFAVVRPAVRLRED
jgi:fucose permease